MKKVNTLTFFILASLFWVSSCKKAPGPVLNLAIASPDSVLLSMQKNTMTASWQYETNEPVVSFVVQLSTDRDFGSILESDTLDPQTAQVVYDNLSNTINAFYFRVKATTDNVARNSPWVTQSLTLENILQPVGKTDVTGTSVTLKWDPPAEGTVNHVTIQSDGATPVDVQISGTDIQNRSITVDDLTPATTYTAVLYNDDVRKGVVTFTTVDTRAEIKINSGTTNYQTLQDAIGDAAAGDTIYVRGIYDFSTSTVSIDKSLVIREFPDADRMPEISLVNFELTGNVGDVVLSGLKITGSAVHTVDVVSPCTADITVEHCDISGFTAGVVYASSSATAATYGFTMNDCLVHDIGNSGGDFIDFRAGTLTKLNISNTTFWNLARSFFRIDDPVICTATDPLVMENCTLNNVVSQRFMYLRCATILKFEINKCVLSNTGASSSNGIVNSYADADNVSGNNSDKFLQYFNATNVSSENPQYKDAANGDFTLGNQTLIDNGWGDPRWIP